MQTADLETRPFTQEETRARKGEALSGGARTQTEQGSPRPWQPGASGGWTLTKQIDTTLAASDETAPALFAAHISPQELDDLLLLDRQGRKVLIQPTEGPAQHSEVA